MHSRSCLLLSLVLACVAVRPVTAVTPYIYGIHDAEPLPQEYLNHFTSPKFRP